MSDPCDNENCKENIVVSVRLRPLTDSELDNEEVSAWDVLEPDRLALHYSTPRINGGGGVYEFDRVFPSETRSERVFQEVARPLVDSAMNGMNATLFAYGQTGSGKTYTMNFITREAAEHIFTHIATQSNKQYLIKYTHAMELALRSTIRMSAIEIYNEVVRDLLVEDGEGLRVLDDPERGPVVERLTELGVTSIQDMEQMLHNVESKRQIAGMRLNEFSSRSHTIVRLYIECTSTSQTGGQRNPPESQELVHSGQSTPLSSVVTVSTLNFVDLAGSERSSSSGLYDNEQRKRLKEGCHINRSLLTLGTVIRRLADANGMTHVPYRDSNLTRILQPSLSGNARMGIVCTISPAASAVDMSRAALHFATCAKKVQMRPQINKVIDSKAQMKQLMEETRLLKKQLEAFKTGSNFEALNLELQKKDEEILDTTHSRNLLQKRLENLEKLVLRAKPGTPKKRRVSLNDVCGSPLALDDVFTPRTTAFDNPAYGLTVSRRNTLISGSSENPYASWDGHRLSTGNLNVSPRVNHGQLQMDWWLSPAVRRRLLHLGEPNSHELNSSKDSHNSISSMEWKSDGLSFQKEDDAEKEELIAALKRELDGGKNTRAANDAASQALDALERKIKAILTNKETHSVLSRGAHSDDRVAEDGLRDAHSLPLPDRSGISSKKTKKSLVFEFLINSEHNSGLLSDVRAGTGHNSTSVEIKATATLGKSRRKSAHTPGASQKSVKESQEVDTTAQEDVSCLREFLEEYKSHMNRLECQKRMLLNQVVKLESRLSSSVSKYKKIEKQLVSTKSDLDRVLDSKRDLEAQTRAIHSPFNASSGGFKTARDTRLELPSPGGCYEIDSWADSPTVESMLPKIVDLWEELHVPLSRRSRFYLAFRGGELFYYEAEYRRLLWEKAQLIPSDKEEDNSSEPHPTTHRNRGLRRASKRLENERRWLASQVKFEFNAEEREALFNEWGVPLDAKERKLKLVHKFWSPDIVRNQSRGIENSANIVLQLLGGEDLATNALDLIFRPPSGDDQHIPVPYLISQISRRFSRQSSFLG